MQTTESTGFAGVLVPVLTPFRSNLSPNAGRWVTLCRALLAAGADGLAVFGTTSEANSMSAPERRHLLEWLLASRIPPARLMVGTGSCALPEAVDNARHAVGLGCGGVLMLPPWYYKNPCDDGLFAFYAETIERIGDARLRLYLYHFPAMSQVPLSLDLIERLITAYPDTVVGIKDSSGDPANTRALIERFPGFKVFCGSEQFLLGTLRHGGSGCITATGNVNVHAIRRLIDAWQDAQSADTGRRGSHGSGGQAVLEEMQQQLSSVRALFSSTPAIPLMKAFLALRTGKPGWVRVRPPFCPVIDDSAHRLDIALTTAGYDLGPLITVLR